MTRITFISLFFYSLTLSHVYSKCVFSYTTDDFRTREVKCIDGQLDEINNKTFTTATRLTVIGMKLEKLPNETFRYPHLTSLSIINCEFDYVHQRAFSNLLHLGELTVEHNRLHNVNLNSFHDQVSLQSLTLRNDTVRLLHTDMFRNTKRLKRFDVSFNRLELIDFGMLRFTPRIELLNLTSNSIRHLIVSDVESNLEVLVLRANRLTDVGAASFKNFKLLKELDLSMNEIKDVDADSFRSNVQLQSLDLSKNRISVLPNTVFHNLALLKRLDLSSNWIVSLPPAVFKYLASLEQLYLLGNCIKDFEIDRLSEIRALKVLHSKYLPLNTSDADPDSLSDLTELRLDNWFVCDSFKEVYTGDVFRYPRLLDVTIDRKTVLLTHDDIDYVPVVRLEIKHCRLTRLPPYTFKVMHELEHLDLSNNDIQEFSNDQFESQSNLKRLILVECGIKSLNLIVFQPLKSLKYLNLDGNKLVALPSGIFRLPYLERVSVRHNSLNGLPKDLLGRDTYVEYLDVSSNKISNFKPGTFNNTYLIRFEYADNPIHCVCLNVIKRELKDALILSDSFERRQNCVDAQNSQCSARQAQLYSCAIAVHRTGLLYSIASLYILVILLK